MSGQAIAAIVTASLAGVSGLLYKVLKLVLEYIRRREEKHDAAMEAQRREFETFMGNHMSKMSTAMDANARASERVADRLEMVEQSIRRRYQ
jgi:hypothetical protein